MKRHDGSQTRPAQPSELTSPPPSIAARSVKTYSTRKRTSGARLSGSFRTSVSPSCSGRSSRPAARVWSVPVWRRSFSKDKLTRRLQEHRHSYVRKSAAIAHSQGGQGNQQ